MAIETLNPATGELVKTFPEANQAEVDRVLEAPAKAQRAWARTSWRAPHDAAEDGLHLLVARRREGEE